MEILGYFAALLVGLSLGLTGSGGAILTVPILVYLMRFDPVISMAYSLFVVGVTSLVGAFKYYQKGLLSFRTALLFGVPSVLTVFLTRRFLVPAIPEQLFSVGSFQVTKALVLMLLFAVLMVFASLSMIRKRKFTPEPGDGNNHEINRSALLAQGVGVGLISGMVGAGGGFLIIPALVLFSRLDMKTAVGTSLLIITANSLFGFVGDIFIHQINWLFLLAFSALSVVGIFIGSSLSNRIKSDNLRTGFGWFVLVMGIYILVRELIRQT